jgi:hypothetical protein
MTNRNESHCLLRRTLTHLMRACGMAVLVNGSALAAQQPPSSPPLPCSWPVEITGAGSTNVAYPDTDATYWVMPFDTAAWQTMTVKGQFPESRFFSFVSYLDNGNVVDSLVDADIVPDPGSSNPFMFDPAGQDRNYTVTINQDNSSAVNHLRLGNSQLAYVLYRIYVPDRGLGRSAGVALPAVTLLAQGGTSYPLQPCQPAAADTVASSTSVDPQTASQAGSATASCPQDEGLLLRDRTITFVPSSGAKLFSNPATTYVMAGGLCPRRRSIIVIRGRAPVFPDTYNGSSIFQPAISGDIQVRYWSLCNNNEISPYPVVACQPDWATKLDDEGLFTYVVSQDNSGLTPPEPPSWLPPDATWLPWGDQTVPNILIFRTMLPDNFTLTGDYSPRGVFCNEQLFVWLGWRACFAAAGELVK